MDRSNEVARVLESNLPFQETLDDYKPQTELQEKALKNIIGLIRFLSEHKNGLPIPIMFAMHGRPGTGKTHLLRALLNELAVLNVSYNYLENPDMTRLKPVEDLVLAVDDLFATKTDVSKLDQFDFRSLEKIIFDIYSNRKVLIFTSNFSLSEIVNFIKKRDKQGRLISRINEFVGVCPDMEIDGEDYRLKKGQDHDMSKYFS